MWIPTKQCGAELLQWYRSKLEADEGLKTLRARLKEIFLDMNWVIAGGAIRDVILGRSPRDYDVFVLGSKFRIMQALLSVGIPALAKKEDEHGPMAEFEHNGRKVQIMARKGSPEDVIENFDFNICMLGWDNTGWIHAYMDLKTDTTLRMHKIRYPRIALRRAVDLAGRYALAFSHDDRVALVDAAFDAAYNDPEGTDTGYGDKPVIMRTSREEPELVEPVNYEDIPY